MSYLMFTPVWVPVAQSVEHGDNTKVMGSTWGANMLMKKDVFVKHLLEVYMIIYSIISYHSASSNLPQKSL